MGEKMGRINLKKSNKNHISSSCNNAKAVYMKCGEQTELECKRIFIAYWGIYTKPRADNVKLLLSFISLSLWSHKLQSSITYQQASQVSLTSYSTGGFVQLCITVSKPHLYALYYLSQRWATCSL